MLKRHLIASALLTISINAEAATVRDAGIVGLWERSEPARMGHSAQVISLRFLPNGIFEMRSTKVSRGTSDGFAESTGYYRIVAPSSYVMQVASSLMCASTSSCVPDPIGAQSTEIAPLTTGRFQTTGVRDIMINGERWRRIADR